MIRHLSLLTLCTGAALLAAPATVSASPLRGPAVQTQSQSAQEPDEAQRVEVVTVSATRLPVRLSDMPVAVTTWEARDLQDAPAIVLDQALRSSPAVSLFRRTSSRDSHPTAQGLNLRGIAPSGVSRALVLVDGVPMNDPFGGWVYWDRVPLLAIEQVEVALGGGSAPYGSQALGGVLQIVTRKRIEESLQLQAFAGNQSTVRFGVAAGGAFDGGSVFASAQVFNTAGYIQTAEEERGSVDVPIALNNQAGRVRLDLGGFTVNVDGLRELRDNGTPLQENNTSYGGVSVAYAALADSGNSGWNAYAMGRTQEFESSFTSVAADRNSERLTLLQKVPSTDFGAGGHGWNRWGNGAGSVSYGGDWRRVDGRSEDFVVFTGATREPGGIQNAGGGFAAIDWTATPTLALSAGVRVDGWHQEPFEDDLEARSASAVSPRAGLSWQSAGGAFVRGSGYGAFRAPTLNELYRQFRVGNVITSANPDLEKERLWGGELGAGWTGPIGTASRLTVDGTFYWNSLDDAIINATVEVTNNLIFRRRENLGSATARGLEINGRLDVGANWEITAAYAWLDSFIREAVPGTDPDLTVGNRLPQVPTYRTRATVWYRADPGWAASLSVGAFGEQFEDDLNLLALAPAAVVDASVEIPIIDGVRFTVRAENLLDERVEFRRAPVLAYGAPRLVYAGVTLAWPD